MEKQTIFKSDNDQHVLETLDQICRQVGNPKSDKENFINSKTDAHIILVTYSTGFDLYWFSHMTAIGDSGFTMVLVKNFMTENSFNVKVACDLLKIDYAYVMAQLTKQIFSIAEKIKYPFTIDVSFEKEFIGFRILPNHPLDPVLS